MDHWVAWPTGEGLESVTQNLRPNDEGQEIWSEAFLEFFLSIHKLMCFFFLHVKQKKFPL